jgi:MFS family permease
MVAFTIPAVLFGSLAGVFVDRWSKKAVLVISNLLRGMLVLTIPLFLWLSQNQNQLFHLPFGFWILLMITFSCINFNAIFRPC